MKDFGGLTKTLSDVSVLYTNDVVPKPRGQDPPRGSPGRGCGQADRLLDAHARL
jgi:hypothetical protein